MQYRATVLTLFLGAGLFTAISQADGSHPLTLADILSWKRIQAPAVSNDGQWLAYRVTPAEGNAEVVIRNLKDGKEQRFPAGDSVAASGQTGIAISADSHWVAFNTSPTTKDAKAQKKAKKPIEVKVVLVELATGRKVEFDKIRQFAFSGDMSTVLALHRSPADAAPTPPPAAAAAPASAAASNKPTGTDLILYELASGREMSLGNVSEFAFDKPGDRLAWIVDATDKEGNGIEFRDMHTGDTQVLDSAKANYKHVTWTEKGDALAALRGVEDKGFEEKLYSLVAFRDFGPSGPKKIDFDPRSYNTFPADMSISPNRAPAWRDDLSAVLFGIQEIKPKKNAAKGKSGDAEKKDDESGVADEDRPDLVLWHYKDSRLPSMQQVQENADKNFSYLAEYRPAESKFIRLSDDALRSVTLAFNMKNGVGVDIRDYELESNLDGKRFEDVYVVDPATGGRKLALKKAEHFESASPDGEKLLYADDGVFSVYDVATGKSAAITSKIPSTFWNTESDVNQVKPPTPVLGWTKDSSAVLIGDEWDIWKVPVAGGDAVNLTMNGKKDKIRYRTRFRLDPDERGGIDLSQPLYVSAYGEFTKKNGIALIEPGKPGVQMLQWADASYPQLIKAKHADTYIYSRGTVHDYPDLYAAGSRLDNGQKVTETNPQQKDVLWTSGVRIIDYTSTRGDKLQAALYLPANYEAGKRYPTMVEIYEKLSQGANNYPQPTYNGFSIAYYTSNGYAVLEPDIVYKVNDPGISSVGCVVPAVKAAVASGVVDEKRVGLHGHSWGGYQTAFMVTQTDTFHAAVAGAPLTDMITMYSLLYRNSGSANQPIFESSQGRFAGGYWDNLEAYERNSPVYHAKNVHTPLLLLHNDKDGAVDQTQGIEYFNTLRRLGKPVVMLEYKGENHGLAKPRNMKDYTVRMKEWFDHYLMDKPAPKWMTDGIPLLKMKDDLDERVTEMNQPASAAEPAKSATGGGQQK
ncbi:MAG TPA: prolyl oligopeptidase family serine peptidase [Bryobacteraceae bacterium]|jgi:dipeptidyl aminopeptidase/acylaminoacyl peptidase|nr:prolyl oligopeptidase family serine peptidase [Bryobacteraceae bacterium]